MISDVLADAVEGIDRYLKAEPEAYSEAIRQHILRVRSEMKVLQTRLDAPLSAVELDREQEIIDTYRARRYGTIEPRTHSRLGARLRSSHISTRAKPKGPRESKG